MKFSITIPTYKSRYLREAIDSVVNQTYTDWELIIVDDCSPEDLRIIVEPYMKDSRVSYYRNEKNIGAEKLVENWNRCLSYCQGDFVLCIGDDDRMLPNCLSDLQALIEKYPDLDVYHSRTQIIDEDGQVKETLALRDDFEDALAMIENRWNGRRQYIGDFCYRRSSLMKNGGYYPLPFAWGSDDITAFRAALSHGIANTIQPGFQYRENRYSISLSQNEEKKAEAVLEQRKWYSETLKSISASQQQRTSLTATMTRFTNNLILHHVRNDISRRGVKRLLYWVGLRRHYDISLVALAKLYMKSI